MILSPMCEAAIQPLRAPRMPRLPSSDSHDEPSAHRAHDRDGRKRSNLEIISQFVLYPPRNLVVTPLRQCYVANELPSPDISPHTGRSRGNRQR